MNYILYLHDNEDKDLFTSTPFQMRGQMWRFSVLTDSEVSPDTRLIRYHRIESPENGQFFWSDYMFWVFPVSSPFAGETLGLDEIQAEIGGESPIIDRLRYLIAHNPIPHRS